MYKGIFVKSKSGISFEVKKGDKITVIDAEGKQVADFFAVSSLNNREVLSTGVTIDCNGSLDVMAGNVLL